MYRDHRKRQAKLLLIPNFLQAKCLIRSIIGYATNGNYYRANKNEFLESVPLPPSNRSTKKIIVVKERNKSTRKLPFSNSVKISEFDIFFMNPRFPSSFRPH